MPDGNGNMLTKTDGDGYVTEYSYNSLDLVSHINYNDAKEVSYQYNKVGELVKMDDWLGTTAFEVDLLGQLKKVTDHKGNVVSYEYDAVGNQTSITYPDEAEVSKTYDALGQLTKVTDAEQKNYLYEYDDAGRVTKLTYPNGWVEEYTYDNEGNLLKTVDTDPFHNNKKSTKFEYRYDAEGNLVSEYKRDTTASNRALTTTYAYDALNRLTSAHEEGVGVNTTRTYQYDTLGNLIRQEQDGCIEYKYNGYSLDETTKCGTIPNSIGTSYWEYTYDGRGNLVSNDKYTRTTSGMAWENEETYVYDETNHLVQGKNEDGEYSLYTYNGLGIRVGRELILKDNTHGYTDFHSQTPSVETGLTKPEVVKESYVIDYTSATFNTLVMDEEGGFNYRWVYGLDRLSVKITSEGTNWWGQHVTTDILKDYTHQDRLGSTVNLSDQFGRVVGRADYNEWGEVTYKEALSITSSYRRIWPQLNYTGYDWDDVLGMYYAKARFYSADDKRFVAIDPIKGQITDPLSLVSYLYCVDNPLKYVDPLGMLAGNLDPHASYVYFDGNGGGGAGSEVGGGMIIIPLATGVVAVVSYVGNVVSFWVTDHIDDVVDFLFPPIKPVIKLSIPSDKTYVESAPDVIIPDNKDQKEIAPDVIIPGNREQREIAPDLIIRPKVYEEPGASWQPSINVRPQFPAISDEREAQGQKPILPKPKEYMEQAGCEGQGEKTPDSTDTKEQTADSYEDAKRTGKKAPKHTEVEGRRLPPEGEPNSSADLKQGGKIKQRRYYGPNGKPEIDIDYTDHGSPRIHSNPHAHRWNWNENPPQRSESIWPW